MTLRQKTAKKFDEELAVFEWFVSEIEQYVKDGDLTREQADLLIEDKREQLDL